MDQIDAERSASDHSIRPSMLRAIGNTPLVRLNKIPPADSADILVKLEYYNPTGSYKDRMALSMIEGAEARGDLRPGMRVIEYTGGSTGSSLAFVCAVKGYRLEIVTSDAYAREKLQTMRAFGANLTVIPSGNGQITRELVNRMIDTAHELASQPDTYFTDQLNNPDVVKEMSPSAEDPAQVMAPSTPSAESRHGLDADGDLPHFAARQPGSESFCAGTVWLPHPDSGYNRTSWSRRDRNRQNTASPG
jgi:hypothetical protein